MAALLSVAPGLGQIYIGYYTRGFLMGGVFLMLLTLANNAPRSVEPMPGMATFFFWLFNVIDAGRLAALYNHAAAGTERIELPEDFQMPAMGGSIIGGGILVLFGVLALSHTLFGYSLDWIESWWPVLPLTVGAYLLVKGIQDQSKASPVVHGSVD